MAMFMLALPTNYNLLEVLYLFAGYYAVHIAVLFFYLGTYGEGLQKRGFKTRTYIMSICLAFLLGMQGARGLLVIYGPAFAVEIIRYCHLFWMKRKPKQTDWIISIWVLLNLLFNLLGSCIPVSVNVGFSRNIRKGFHKLWTTVLPDIADVLGIFGIGMFGQICLVTLLLNALYILVGIIYKMCKKRELEILEWIYLLICVSPIMTVFMVAFTTVESTGRYYFMFLIVMAMSVVMSFVRQERYMVVIRIMCWVAIGYLSIVNIANLYIPIIKSKEPPENEYKAVTDFLEKNEYQSAYATFENANTMTVVSNGKVNVAPVASVEKMDKCKWLSSERWYPPYVDQKQPTAYIVTESQMPEFENFLLGKERQVEKIQEIGKFHIYVSEYNFVN